MLCDQVHRDGCLADKRASGASHWPKPRMKEQNCNACNPLEGLPLYCNIVRGAMQMECLKPNCDVKLTK